MYSLRWRMCPLHVRTATVDCRPEVLRQAPPNPKNTSHREFQESDKGQPTPAEGTPHLPSFRHFPKTLTQLLGTLKRFDVVKNSSGTETNNTYKSRVFRNKKRDRSSQTQYQSHPHPSRKIRVQKRKASPDTSILETFTELLLTVQLHRFPLQDSLEASEGQSNTGPEAWAAPAPVLFAPPKAVSS